ncbi:GTP 3',8-cyclase MoaA [Candidatus Venteria ishoeyi]|uniref:GTP 3',8-cyclase n=1 Tax=Candidatus Venteria ishoeyi TaxID=1899563 RepID=A0A1H6FB17_9GAMM|nr:GTP 3',8-cyclase MoaA [Candidatus Venteria ishoeyi]SEH06833.1 Cyclic pyranopterin monophosphate synthase [Candidatus Venteria ishoeyi]
MTTANTHPLIDRFNRHINYLRISVTDRCDFRCVYCMDEKMQFLPREQILTLEEIEQIARAFVLLGVKKIRITGGEPLVRRNILSLFERLGALPGLKELVLTTNGSQLSQMAKPLRESGVKRINISLDSLQADKFLKLTRNGKLDKVLAGIDAAREAGFERIKLNAVILKHRNHEEVPDLVDFAIQKQLDLTFIEEMPLGLINSHDRAEAYYSSDDILADLKTQYQMLPTPENTGGPARYYRLPAHPDTRIGFISPHSHDFCDTCNRVRLTAEGRLLLCLGQENSVDLRRIVRAHPGDAEYLQNSLLKAIHNKPHSHDFSHEKPVEIMRYMNTTGG